MGDLGVRRSAAISASDELEDEDEGDVGGRRKGVLAGEVVEGDADEVMWVFASRMARSQSSVLALAGEMVLG